MQFSDLDRYDYNVPPELIRKTPIEPRDNARLFVYDTATDTVRFDVFRNLAQYLPLSSLVVLNDTKVRPARLWLRKSTGGTVEVFVLINEWDGGGEIPALVDRKVTVGETLRFPDGSSLVAIHQSEARFSFRLESEQSLFTLLETYGVTPIPHYLETNTTMAESDLRTRYQTVFAAAGASVAAPTAALHFTDAVFKSFSLKEIETSNITLDVGLGTFASLTAEAFRTGRLHREYVTVTEQAAHLIKKARLTRKPVIAVGTTVARTLETIVINTTTKTFQGPIDTFIYPPYTFQSVDCLITNFHLPKTSLMLLVDALLQDKDARRGVVELYNIAIKERFTFYSFGDSMLIL